jgi:hypothetical protein
MADGDNDKAHLLETAVQETLTAVHLFPHPTKTREQPEIKPYFHKETTRVARSTP